MVRSFWRYWVGGFVEVSPGLEFRAAINRQNHIKKGGADLVAGPAAVLLISRPRAATFYWILPPLRALKTFFKKGLHGFKRYV